MVRSILRSRAIMQNVLTPNRDFQNQPKSLISGTFSVVDQRDTVAGRPAALRFRSIFRPPKWGPPNSTKTRPKKAVDKQNAMAGAIREYFHKRENVTENTNLVLACTGWAARSCRIWPSWGPQCFPERGVHTSPMAPGHFRRAHYRHLRLSCSAVWMFTLLHDSWARGASWWDAHINTHTRTTELRPRRMAQSRGERLT